MGSGFKDLVSFVFHLQKMNPFGRNRFSNCVDARNHESVLFQHVQQFYGSSVLYDAKKERSLQKMLLRCDGNESQKTVFTHRVKSQVFLLSF